GEHPPRGAGREGYRGHAIVSTGREVDDHAIHVRQGDLQCGQRSDRNGPAAGSPDEGGQPGRPDQVVRQDGHALAQDRLSARWWKTSRAVTTPVGLPSLMTGIWRNPPTAILWIARAIGSS